MSTTFARRQLSNVVSSRATARLRAFRRDVEFALPGRVALVVLFGSRARGDARRSIDHILADTAYRHILAGVHIRPVAVPADYLESRPRDMLAMNIAQDGIAVQ